MTDQPTTGLATTAPDNPMQLLSQAVTAGVDPDALEKLMALQERWQAVQARKAYAVAMSAAQRDMPTIPKNGWNPQTKSKFEKMEDIVRLITPVYTKHGLSLSFDQQKAEQEKGVRVVCYITHKDGHETTRFLEAGIDDAGMQGTKNKTNVQGTGSTISYLRRYLMKMTFNLDTGDDNDGNEPEKTITENEAIELEEMLGTIKDTTILGKVLTACGGIQSIYEMPAGKLVLMKSKLVNKIKDEAAEATQ